MSFLPQENQQTSNAYAQVKGETATKKIPTSVASLDYIDEQGYDEGDELIRKISTQAVEVKSDRAQFFYNSKACAIALVSFSP